MFKVKRNIIAFVPARSGSKSLKNKNLKRINNQNLIEITLKLALKSKLFSSVVLSSNSKKILNFGQKFKKVKNVLRPKSLALDNSKTDGSILHYLRNNKYTEKYLVILQVTSPLRKEKTLNKFIKYCIKKKLKNCLTVTHKLDHFSNFGKYFNSLENKDQRRRQQRKGFLVENGLIYFVNIADFLKRGKIYSNKWDYYITNEYESIDINNVNDLRIVKKLF